MGNAIWSTLSLLPSFFWAALGIFDPTLHPLAWLSAACLGCFITSVLIGMRRRLGGLFAFLVPIALSHLLFFAAVMDATRVRNLAFYEGRDSAVWSWVMPAFPLLQLGLCGFLIYRFHTYRVAASLLSVFTLAFATYACFGAFIVQSVD